MKNVSVPLDLMYAFRAHLKKGSDLDIRCGLLINEAENPMVELDDFAAKLTRPIVFFDVETTGTSVSKDRIISLDMLKLWPDGTVEKFNWLLDPTILIPKEASAVHKIFDEDVAGKFTFLQIHNDIFAELEGCDLGTFNGDKFDIPLLCEEFHRCGVQWPQKDTVSIDVSNIFRKNERRSLVAAAQFYLQENIAESAHDSAVDTEATFRVFLAQLKRYPGLMEMTLQDISKETCLNPSKIDIAGKFMRNEAGEAVYAFGKHQGQRIKDWPGYVDWMLGADFTADTKRHGRLLLEEIGYI